MGTAIKNVARMLAGPDFGDLYHDADVYYLGFTRNAANYLPRSSDSSRTSSCTHISPREGSAS